MIYDIANLIYVVNILIYDDVTVSYADITPIYDSVAEVYLSEIGKFYIYPMQIGINLPNSETAPGFFVVGLTDSSMTLLITD